MKKVLLAILAVGVLAAGGIYMYINKGHRDVADAEPELVVQAQELIKAFETDEQGANAKYVGKLIEINGVVGTVDSAQDGSTIILLESDNPMSTVMCQLDPIQKEKEKPVQSGQKIRIKGLCSGFTTDVVIDRCHIME
ncbi:MAG: hypothetical protein J5I59_12410 [Saprospiraceae bacterium]|nr:hypothetical protein [Saprospiraceae bacterium]